MSELKRYVGSKNVTLEPIEYCDFLDPQGWSWTSEYTTQNNLYYIHINVVNFKPYCSKESVTPTVCCISNQTLSQLVHKHFGSVSTPQLKYIEEKVLTKGVPINLPELDEPCEICLLLNETKITRVTTFDASKFDP